MILELVDESRLLIILSPEDMEDYQLTFDSLDWQNGHSRSVIKEFLRIACRQKGFCPGDSRLLIEAVPDEEGCVLLVTMLPEEKAKRKVYRIKENQPSLTPFLFRFDQAENLLAAVDRCRQQGMTVVVITHNSAIAPMADQVIHVKNGRVERIDHNDRPVPVETIEW